MADFGGIDVSQIEVVAKEVGASPEAGSSPIERFAGRVAQLVEGRFEKGEAKGVSVFLRSLAIKDDVKDRKTKPIPMLGNGEDAISQQVLISNTALTHAHALEIVPDEHIFSTLEAHGLDGLPAFIVDWRGDKPKAMFFRSGVSNPEDVELVYLSSHEITATELKEILDQFYDQRMRTPQRISEGHGQKVWEKAASGWPAEKPEERIQGKLITFLRGKIHPLETGPEIPNADGRLDISIYAKLTDLNGQRVVKKIWVIELKALTDKTTAGDPVPASSVKEALEKGLRQAISYKDAIHANRAALCCYDMRKQNLTDDEVFASIRDDAAAQEVHLWRWYLHRSSDSWRKANVPLEGAKLVEA
ncbi:hypothetical protein D3C85_807990 [compost metagenome]